MNSRHLKIAVIDGLEGLFYTTFNYYGQIEIPWPYEIDYPLPLLRDSSWKFFAEDDYRRYIAEQSEGVL